MVRGWPGNNRRGFSQIALLTRCCYCCCLVCLLLAYLAEPRPARQSPHQQRRIRTHHAQAGLLDQGAGQHQCQGRGHDEGAFRQASAAKQPQALKTGCTSQRDSGSSMCKRMHAVGLATSATLAAAAAVWDLSHNDVCNAPYMHQSAVI